MGQPVLYPKTVRLAHLTDLHLLSLDGASFSDFVNKRWTGAVNLLLNRGRHYLTEVFDALVDDLNSQAIDQVACTGDVSNLSLASELRFARAHFDRIAVGASNVICVPGNHDTYIAEAVGLFEQLFAPYCGADEGWQRPGAPAGPAQWPVVRVRGDLALIGLSTSQPSAWFMGYGSVGRAQLDLLESALRDPRLDGKFRVVVMHHPSAGRHARSLRRGLHDHQDFAGVIRRAGAELVVHGHEHLDLREVLSGPAGAQVPVLGVQSGSYAIDSATKRARYRIFHIERTSIAPGARPRLLSAELRTWRPRAARFEPEDQATSHP